jgi:RHS repeat-associated protein
MKRKIILIAFGAVFLFAFTAVQTFGQEVDMHNPIGVTGIFNGNVETGCSYDPLSHSSHRAVDDIVVPGSVGKYPLKMTRYYNSRKRGIFNLGPGWSHEYNWSISTRANIINYPNGNALDKSCQTPVGVSEYLDANSDFRLADGGIVHFGGNPQALRSITDPYGNTTTIDYPDANSMTVTEPGGRYLKFIYGGGLLRTVESYDGVADHPRVDWVNYSYSSYDPGNGSQVQCLTGVTYSDGTTASYDYRQDNASPAINKVLPLLATASDKRYKGPMRQIAFDYQHPGPHGAITAERFDSGGTLVSRIDPGATLCTSFSCGMETDFTETRGDELTRTFTYTHLGYYTNPSEGGCPETVGGPPSQFLKSYTDFQNRKTWIGYDPVTWYITSVTDARGTQQGDPNYTTTYQRGPAPPSGIGQITRITHPDSSFIQYDYQDSNGDPHYVTRITDERGNVTKHSRDVKHRIYRTEYRNPGTNDSGALLAFETFTYCDQIDPQCSNNPLGQIKTHKLKNGAYVHYRYDTRGLLTDKWEPTWNSSASEGDPKIHFDYYTSGRWTDRLKTRTLPPNYPHNYQGSETYEYDIDGNGNRQGGRGLVTKITHADGTYQTFGYDAYGNKLWEENELRQRTRYTYDSYNRVLSVEDPLHKFTTYTYIPTGGGSSYKHTTNNPDTVTTPEGIITKNVYDANFRKTQSTVGYQTPDAATAWLDYDNIGNPKWMTDPRGTVGRAWPNGDPAYTTYTDYDNRNRKWRIREPLGRTTWFEFGDNINITRIHRADGTLEQKSYDGMNRITTDTVPKEQGVDIVTRFQYYPNNVRSATLLQKVVDGESHVYQFEYDPSGMKTKLIYPNNSTQEWAYDDAHNLESRTTVAGEIQNFAYDQRNRKNLEWWDGWPADAEWRGFDYDDANRLTLATNGIGTYGTNFIADVRRFYDDAGRMWLDRQTVYVNGVPNTKEVNYPAYDDDGRLLRMYVNAVSPAYDYSFGYDDVGRLETIKPTGGSLSFQYSYDPASNETQRYNLVNHIAQNYVPDSLNRMTSVEIKNTSTNIRLGLEAYDYYIIGRLHTVTREDNKQDSFVYYLDGELQQATYAVTATPPPNPSPTPTPPSTPTPPGGQVAEPRFNPDGWTTNQHTLNVTISTTTAGAQMRYTINDPTPPSPTYGTLIDGTSGTITLILGEVTLQAIAFKTGMTPSVIHSADFVYDNGMSPILPNPSWLSYPLERTANYLGEGATDPTVNRVTYTLDKAGNRQSVNSTSYIPNAINQYTSVGGSAVTNGNDHQIQLYGGFTYTYMRDQELTRISAPGWTYDVAYDALGRCVKRTVNNDPTYYIYDGDRPILEYRSNGRIARNVYGKGVDEILMRTDPAVNSGQSFYFQQDHEGSTTHLTNGSGQVIERYRYDAFGIPTIYAPNWTVRTASSYNNRFLFTGREYLGASVYEYRARVYHAGIGRFMSEDPKLFDAGDYNLFRYCHNDPVDFTDPMGLDFLSSTQDFVTGAGDSISLGATAYIRDSLPGIYGFAGVNANSTAYGFGEGTGFALGMATGEGEAAVARVGIRGAKQTANKVAAVIGKFKNSPNYVNVAEKLGAKYLNIPKQIWGKMSPAERWTANQKFLDRAIARGGDFLLDKPIKSISSTSGGLRRELDYLSEKGFKLSPDGGRMTRHIPLPERQ